MAEKSGGIESTPGTESCLRLSPSHLWGRPLQKLEKVVTRKAPAIFLTFSLTVTVIRASPTSLYLKEEMLLIQYLLLPSAISCSKSVSASYVEFT